MARVNVLLAAYKGEKFIGHQIQSILNQTHKPNKIFVNIDQSTDQTFSISNNYAKNYPEIQILNSNIKFGSAAANFNNLLCNVDLKDIDYIALADQDDLWKPQKIEMLLQKMSILPDNNQPALVFSDVNVVDENLNLIFPSLEKFQKFKVEHHMTLKHLLFYCPALGCTMMFNNALLKLAVAMPTINDHILSYLVSKVINREDDDDDNDDDDDDNEVRSYSTGHSWKPEEPYDDYENS